MIKIHICIHVYSHWHRCCKNFVILIYLFFHNFVHQSFCPVFMLDYAVACIDESRVYFSNLMMTYEVCVPVEQTDMNFFILP